MTDERSKRGTDEEKSPTPSRQSPPQPDSKPEPESDLPPKTEELEAAESDPGRRDDDLDDEDTEDLRRSYLLRRFWHTALRFWTTPGYRVAWLLSAALLVIVLLNLARLLCDEPLESQHLRCAGEEGRRRRAASLAALLRDPGGERLLQRRAGLRPHDVSAPLAQMAHRQPGRSAG